MGDDQPVVWIFARELLLAAHDPNGGEGDVRVWPATGTDGEVLNIALSAPFVPALFEVPAAAVSDFVRRTFQLVPAGREWEFVDVESEPDDPLWKR